jgi:hypothetical protein
MILKVHFFVHLLNVKFLNLDNAIRFYDYLNKRGKGKITKKWKKPFIGLTLWFVKKWERRQRKYSAT